MGEGQQEVNSAGPLPEGAVILATFECKTHSFAMFRFPIREAPLTLGGATALGALACRPMEFVSLANRVNLDPTWMLKVVQMTGFAHDNPRAVQEQMAAIVTVLQGVELEHDDRSMAAASMSFRLEALNSLILSARKHKWDVSASAGSSVTPEALIRCACEEPLIIHKGRPAFDPSGFRNRLRSILN